MSKAEQRAFEAYPPKYAKQERHPKRIQSKKVDTHQPMRTIYIKGYHQAEKDLALTWQDVKKICDIAFEEACRLQRNMKSSYIYKEQHYQEVLNRFNKQKGK